MVQYVCSLSYSSIYSDIAPTYIHTYIHTYSIQLYTILYCSEQASKGGILYINYIYLEEGINSYGSQLGYYVICMYRQIDRSIDTTLQYNRQTDRQSDRVIDMGSSYSVSQGCWARIVRWWGPDQARRKEGRKAGRQVQLALLALLALLACECEAPLLACEASLLACQLTIYHSNYILYIYMYVCFCFFFSILSIYSSQLASQL